jgi:S-adenosylmethionine decarboxylase
MKILHGPVIVEGIPTNPGLSGFAIIDFSHISIHTFSETNEVCVDVFSCKPFDYKELHRFVKEYLELEDKDIKCGIVNYGRLEKIK